MWIDLLVGYCLQSCLNLAICYYHWKRFNHWFWYFRPIMFQSFCMILSDRLFQSIYLLQSAAEFQSRHLLQLTYFDSIRQYATILRLYLNLLHCYYPQFCFNRALWHCLVKYFNRPYCYYLILCFKRFLWYFPDGCFNHWIWYCLGHLFNYL